MDNLPNHHVYSLVTSELERIFKYVYDVESDKAEIEQKQQFISVLEEYIDSSDIRKDDIRENNNPSNDV